MPEYMILHISAFLLGILLDQLIGDPQWMPHPIRAMGALIAALERKLYEPGEPDSQAEDGSQREINAQAEDARAAATQKRRGALLWFTVIAITAAVTMAVLVLVYALNPWLGAAVEAILTCYVLAARSLCRESMVVSKKLQEDDLNGAKLMLSRIVGRDTEPLGQEEVIKAAVETVAENTSDGVIAPLIFTIFFTPVGGMIYKAVNTMDSMLGYRNARYENFGKFAARSDDVFNFLPSRISALGMILATGICAFFSKDYDFCGAWRIWKRDRRNHKSPNSAQTESVCAGALGLCLGGTHLYQGVTVEKPTIGDALRQAETSDIKRANRLMFLTEGIIALHATGLLFLIWQLVKR